MKLQYGFDIAGIVLHSMDPSPQEKRISNYKEMIKKVRKENA